MTWIDSFLCSRQQRIVLNGAKSDQALVSSNVQKGIIRGHLLFPLYINDISTDIDGPPSAVGKVPDCRYVSDCRYLSDCRSRGHEFDHGPVPYFCGD